MYNVRRRFFLFLLAAITISLSAQNFSADREMFDAYKREDMTVWKAYIDSYQPSGSSHQILLYEYGYCGYIVAEDKEAAKPYVARFRADVEASKGQLPIGHYEMYMSAVYVYELRLHQSFHPAKAMSMAKEATQLAPSDPLVLAYYGTSLYYAPKPFGSKKEALRYFERAAELFQGKEWQYCWVREASNMYIRLINNK